MNLEIEAILPHRPPFLWVDHVLSVEAGVRCVASKRIDPEAPFFAGHFPGDPILPGVFLVEAAAQTAGIMMGASGAAAGSQKRLAASGPVQVPRRRSSGAVIEIETRLLVETDGMALVSAVISVAGEIVATRTADSRVAVRARLAAFRRRWSQPQEQLRRLLSEQLEPGPAAAAVWLGIALGIIPIYGFQAIAALALATLFGLNRPLTLAATFINNPLLQPLLVVGSLQLRPPA